MRHAGLHAVQDMFIATMAVVPSAWGATGQACGGVGTGRWCGTRHPSIVNSPLGRLHSVGEAGLLHGDPVDGVVLRKHLLAWLGR